MDGLDDIVEEFLVESHENLDQLDADLVALEQEPDSRERLSSIFRTIHTIKGTSGFLAFHRLEEVTHIGENMLSRLRDGALELTPQRTSVLLQMVDTVRSLLGSIEATGGEGSVDVSTVVAAISAAMEDTPAPAVEPEPAVEAPADAVAEVVPGPAAQAATETADAEPAVEAPAPVAEAPAVPAPRPAPVVEAAPSRRPRTRATPSPPPRAAPARPAGRSPTAPSGWTSTCSTS